MQKEIAKKVKGVDYRLLIASAYTGFLVWHGGLSGSIPLQLASGSPESLAQQTAGAVTAAIPTSQTMFFTNEHIYSCRFINNCTFIKCCNVSC